MIKLNEIEKITYSVYDTDSCGLEAIDLSNDLNYVFISNGFNVFCINLKEKKIIYEASYEMTAISGFITNDSKYLILSDNVENKFKKINLYTLEEITIDFELDIKNYFLQVKI